jgi:hypothetical protein
MRSSLLFGLVVVVCLLGCSRPVSPPPPANATAPSAVATPAPSPASVPDRVLVLRKPADCKSDATAISIDTNPTELTNVLVVFGKVADRTFDCPGCDPGLKVAGAVNDAPWDCLIADLASQAGLEVTVGPEKIVLDKPKPKP